MPHYRYRALNALGKTLTGTQSATSINDLELRLKRQQLDLIHAKLGHAPFSRQHIARSELISFFANLEQLSRAGVPLLDSLYDLRDAHHEAKFRQILSDLLEAIEGGKSFSQALAQQGKVFNPVVISLIIAGETSGDMTAVFQQITATLKWQDEMAAHNKNILLYPSFMAVTVLAITLFLLIYLVPQMLGFIQAMGKTIPLHTRLLLMLSNALLNYWYIFLALPLVGGAAGIFWLQRSHHARYQFDKFKLKIWIIGPILNKIILARFANTFALMYRSGINILSCIAHARSLVNNRAIALGLDEIYRDIEAGKTLAQSFQKTGLFPPLVIRMLKVGETTGSLDSALLNVSYFYDRDIKDHIKRIQTLIEPSMTVILGIVLGWVMLSVLSPIYDVIGQTRF